MSVCAQVVERAKAGDKAVFTGTLIVVPDVSQLNTPGAKAQAVGSSERDRSFNAQNDGLRVRAFSILLRYEK